MTQISPMHRILGFCIVLLHSTLIQGRLVKYRERDDQLSPSIVDEGMEFLISANKNPDFIESAEENGERMAPMIADGRDDRAPMDEELFDAEANPRRRAQLMRQDAFDIVDEDADEAELLRIRQSLDELIDKKQRFKRRTSRTKRQTSFRNSADDDDVTLDVDTLLASPEDIIALHPKSLQEIQSLQIVPRQPDRLREQQYLSDEAKAEDILQRINMNLMDKMVMDELNRVADYQASLQRAKRTSQPSNGYYEELLPREKLGPQRPRRAPRYQLDTEVEDDEENMPVQEQFAIEESPERVAFDQQSEQVPTEEDLQEMPPSIRARFRVCATVKEKFHRQMAFTGKTLELDECYVACERKEDERVFSHVFKLVDWPCGNRLEGKCLPDGSCTAFL